MTDRQIREDQEVKKRRDRQPGGRDAKKESDHSELMLLLEVVVEVVLAQRGQVAMETQRHEKPSISIGGLLLRGVVKYDPCGVQLGGMYGEVYVW